MLKVRNHNQPYRSLNPGDGKWNDLIDVTFIEYGRGTANRTLSESQAFLSSVIGEKVGIDGSRIHTEPMLASIAAKWPVHKDFGGKGEDFPGFINREMHTYPVMASQEDVDPQNVDGQPTYFKTVIGPTAEADKDFRIPLATLATTEQGRKLIERARLRKTTVTKTQPSVKTFTGADDSSESAVDIPSNTTSSRRRNSGA
jgi:hypothetical protein